MARITSFGSHVMYTVNLFTIVGLVKYGYYIYIHISVSVVSLHHSYFLVELVLFI